MFIRHSIAASSLANIRPCPDVSIVTTAADTSITSPPVVISVGRCWLRRAAAICLLKSRSKYAVATVLWWSAMS